MVVLAGDQEKSNSPKRKTKYLLTSCFPSLPTMVPTSVAAAAAGAGAVFLDLTRLHVVDVAGRQDEVRLLPWLEETGVVVDGHLPGAHHFEAVAFHDDRGGLREADAEELRILLDDGNQVIPAVPGVDVLVDRDLAQELEGFLVRWLRRHHHVGAGRVTADQVFPLDRRPGGAAADDAAALEHLVELAIGQRVRIRIDDVPLAAAVEPDGVGVAQDLRELLGV